MIRVIIFSSRIQKRKNIRDKLLKSLKPLRLSVFKWMFLIILLMLATLFIYRKHCDARVFYENSINCFILAILRSIRDISMKRFLSTLYEMCPNTEFFLVRLFPHSDWLRRDTKYLSIFSPNAGKYGPGKLRIWTLFTQW